MGKLKKLYYKADLLAKRSNAFLARNMLMTVILVATLVSLGVAASFHYSNQMDSRKTDVGVTKNTEDLGVGGINQATTQPQNTPDPASAPATSQKTVQVTPPPDKAAICSQLNSADQAIVDSSLQSSYQYYLYQKDATLSKDNLTEDAKESQITHDYTSYQWKVEDMQADTNRSIKEAGCTSTVIAKLQPR